MAELPAYVIKCPHCDGDGVKAFRPCEMCSEPEDWAVGRGFIYRHSCRPVGLSVVNQIRNAQ